MPTSQATVAGLLRELRLPFRLITTINEGWDSDVYDVDGRWIFRFPRRPEVAAALEREARVLPVLAQTMPFDVPDPRLVGTHEGHPYMGYRKLAGQPFARGDDVVSIADALSALHSFPVEEAAGLLGVEPTIDRWVQQYVDLRAKTDKDIAPLLDAEVADALNDAFDRFLASDWSTVTPTFVHHDLGAEHILMDRETHRLSAIIDFGDMTIGDPTMDFVGVRITAGARLTKQAVTAYGGGIDDARMRFYVQVGAVHAVIYGQLIGDEHLVVDAIASLGRRLRGDDGRRA